MRKAIVVIAILGIIGLIVGFYPTYVDKPVLNEPGPMGIYMDPALPAPVTHSPIDYWQSHHPDVVNQGHLTQEDCLYCHVPATSCNNCHNYVGVAEIVASK
ncbi:MAG: hypothetical protein AB1801_18210 [Chloroflexota bacterium]